MYLYIHLTDQLIIFAIGKCDVNKTEDIDKE